MYLDKQMAIWRLALSSLTRDIPVMLLYVLESNGSSPGRQGFFMVVNALGDMQGSIGGGIMEHKFVEMSRERLMQNDHILSIRKQVHDKEASKDQSGMICSGDQTILLYMLRSSDAGTLHHILDSLEQQQNGALRLSPAGIAFSPIVPELDHHFSKHSADNWWYEEKTGYKRVLFIIGGGHCSLALSHIMGMMDFYIYLFDHRPGLVTLSRNTFAHKKIILKDYDELQELIPSGVRHHYIMIMTQGYRTDDLAVRAVLHKDFRYIGLLGSKAKIKKMMEGYRAEGISEAQLQKLHAPAGLSIKSQTPEEIAISIAAEIISIKNEGNP
jgi:xanthine dehydrogenase accessory factor